MKKIVLPLLLALATAAVAQSRTGRDYAVIFTVANYDNPLIWPHLPQIPDEVVQLERLLRTEYGFDVKVVPDATRNKIETTLETYGNKNLYGTDSQLLLFFAMHGQRTTQGQGYLIPKEGTKSATTWLAHTQLSDIINELPCPRILVSIDACYSGTFGDNRSVPGGAVWEMDNLDCGVKRKLAFENKMPTRRYLTAGRADQRVPGKSKFAERWQKALNSKGGEDGILSFAELWAQLYQLDGSGVLATNGTFGSDRAGDFAFICKSCCGATPPPPPVLDNMLLIRGGTFQMGSDDGGSDEKPVHSVTVSDFYLGKYEVTVAEFRAFVEATGHKTDAEKEDGSYTWDGATWEKKSGINWRLDTEGKTAIDNHPVIHVSWNDATAYCQWMSKKTGQTFRLPTEAEWEYAAGNGSRHTKYSWGNGDPSGKKGGNVRDETSQQLFSWGSIFEGYTDGYARTAPVGLYDPNDFGLYDMTGNVWEWCSDWYSSDYYNNSPSNNPMGPSSGSYRVIRGGSWYNYPQGCRVAFRNYVAPGARSYIFGFRLARTK
jgi:formylglycine-generating enzyme